MKRFAAKLESITEILEWVRSVAAQENFKEDSLNKILHAVEEAFVNITTYAYQNSEGIVEISCSPSEQPKGIIIELKDTGPPSTLSPIKKISPPTISVGVESFS